MNASWDSTAGSSILLQSSKQSRKQHASSLGLSRPSASNLSPSQQSGNSLPSGAGSNAGHLGAPKKRNSLTSLSLLVGKSKSAAMGKTSRRGSCDSAVSASSSSNGGKNYSVRDLIERQKWRRLLKVLETPEGREQVRASCGGEGGDDEETTTERCHDSTFCTTAMHHAVMRGAPLDVVRAVGVAAGPALWSGRAPAPSFLGGLWPVVDSCGRTVLHAAAASSSYGLGAKRDNLGEVVINRGEEVAIYLISLTSDPAAISARDHDGRTPLHLACMERPPRRSSSFADQRRGGGGGGGGGDGEGSKKARKLNPAVIRALADAAPAAVQIEDECGLTPLDYAVMSVTDLDGKFCPTSKPSARILSEAAIFPMIRHCRAMWSKGTEEEARAAEAAATWGEDEDALLIKRGSWTKRRSSAVRMAIQAHKAEERMEKERRESEEGPTLDESLHNFLRNEIKDGNRRRGSKMCHVPRSVQVNVPP